MVPRINAPEIGFQDVFFERSSSLKAKKNMVDYAPKVITLEQYMLLYSHDLYRIGGLPSPHMESKVNAVTGEDYVTTHHPLEQKLFEEMEQEIRNAGLRRFTHEAFDICLEMIGNRFARYRQQLEPSEFHVALKDTRDTYPEPSIEKERMDLYEYIWVVPEEEINIDMVNRGDVVAVKDCNGEVVFYTNPYRGMENDFFAINMLGENIYDTVVRYKPDNQLKKRREWNGKY